MSGYRQSSFDPNAKGELFPPPPTSVQRTGIGFLFAAAIAVCALAIALTFYFAGGRN